MSHMTQKRAAEGRSTRTRAARRTRPATTAGRRATNEVFRKDMKTWLDSSYRSPVKHPAGTTCPECGLVFEDGRWKRLRRRRDAMTNAVVCPACRATREGYPGGFVRIDGDFFAANRQAILAKVRNVETATRREHPLNRIMSVDDDESGILVQTTDPRLAERIGHALRRVFKGVLELKYSPDERRIRVWWRRDA